jgi:hypothetical protein
VVFLAPVVSILKLARSKKGWLEFMTKRCKICHAEDSMFKDIHGFLFCNSCYQNIPKDCIPYKESTLEEDCSKIFRSCVELISRKNSDYSGGEKFGSFALSSEISGVTIEEGILVRIGDKLSRLKSLLKSGNQQVKEESIEDTIKDAINYLAILHAFRMGCLDSKDDKRGSKEG